MILVMTVVVMVIVTIGGDRCGRIDGSSGGGDSLMIMAVVVTVVVTVFVIERS